MEVTLHAFQMPPWKRFLLYLCKGGVWNKSEIITAPGPCNRDSLEPQCPCWGYLWSLPRRVLSMAPEDPQGPWIVGKYCAYKHFPERWHLAFIKISMRFTNQKIPNHCSISHPISHVPGEEFEAQRAKMAFPMQSKTTMGYHLTLVWMTIIKEIRVNESWCGRGEKWILAHCWWDCWYSHCGK